MKIKDKPLAFQIWIVFASITLFITLVLSIILPMTLRNFFTDETYATIESAQRLMFNRYDLPSLRRFWESEGLEDSRQTLENIRTVNHFFIYDENQIISSSPLSVEFVNKVKNQAQVQQNSSQQYSGNVEDEKVFYVITKGKALNQDVYLISYMWDSYRQDMVQTLFKRLVLVMLLVFIFSWIPAILVAKYLSKPLVSLEERVKTLANYKWNEPVKVDRKDEIGKLGESIEQLRNQLIYQDEMQQTFLQNVSHDLKTPVMVIRSFSQAIKDGIYPKGDLNRSLEVVDKEAERLEKRIRNLLHLTKLDYLTSHELSKETFSLDKLIKDVIERLSWNRTDIDWQLKLPATNINGDLEQWRLVIENLLDNQIRYAKKTILISLTPGEDDKIILKFWNDGPSIEPEIIDSLFGKFNKGEKGQFGLGLAIVQRIVKLHDAKVWAENEEEGVSFYVEMS